MFKNYFKTALRSLSRKKGYSFINVAGLSMGLACCLIIFQYVAFEYGFDRFHENGRDLYRVVTGATRTGEAFTPGAYTPFGMGPALTASVPEFQYVTRVHPEYQNAIVSSPTRPERVFEEKRAYYVDPVFLRMFSFPLAAGHIKTALQPGTILLSESAARKYFGAANPIGQVLDWTGATERSYRVSGIFKDVPSNSHLQFDFLLPVEDLVREEYANEPAGGWTWNNFLTYVQLRPGADRHAAERKMTQVVRTHRGEEYRKMGRTEEVRMQPLYDVHLNADITGPDVVMGSYRTVYFFTVIGLVTLLIALVNYVNLATARALDRAREVGVRKAIGAQRRQLVMQFLFESALTNLMAAGIAIVLAVSLTPVINELSERQLSVASWLNPWFWGAFLLVFGAGTLLAGLYPAFVLSSFKPVAVLKGRTGSFGAQLWLRRGLVVLQFAASVALIGGTAVVYNQLGYMRRMDLGLNLEQVLTIEGPRVLSDGTEMASAMTTFTQELRRLPQVRQVARSSTLPGQGFNWNGASFRRATSDPSNDFRGVVTYIDSSFASLYGLELLAGRGFASIPISDSEDAPWQVITNETTVRTLGFASPAEAVDQALDIGGYNAQIVGVYKDFNWSSAHETRQNIFFGYTREGRQVSLRVSTDDIAGTIAGIRAIYDRLFPGNVFNYAFADEVFDKQYKNDERFARLFTLFAGLAIAIACLGLFGLASFTTQQRTKEIGVRKVLGASVTNLVGLLSLDFLKLVVVAVLIAPPVAYLLIRKWLEGFAYRVEIGVGVFVIVGALALIIALLTIAYQSVSAALVNPSRSLRVE